jgi:hypothetical protein
MSAQQRAVLYVVVVFFTGVVTGALVMNIVEHVWMHPGVLASRAPTPNAWDKDREHYMEQFRSELHLTDEQSKQLEQILDETMRQYEDLHSFSHHIREDGLARIRAMLNDDQRKKFDQLTAKMTQERSERRRREAGRSAQQPGAEPAQPPEGGAQPAPQTTPQP